jgi:DNA-binding NarL/FixJ family response regulator
MRVAAAEDGALFYQALDMLLRSLGIDVAYMAKNGEDLLAFVDLDPPDAVILDIRMPPGPEGGLWTFDALQLRHPSVGVLMLSHYAESAYMYYIFENSRSGGVGYLLKERTDAEGLRDALIRVSAGEPVMEGVLVKRLLERPSTRNQVDALTGREREVLQHMAEGRSNAGIGRILDLSPRTVERHVYQIFEKLSIPSGESENRRVLAVLSWIRTSAR